ASRSRRTCATTWARGRRPDSSETPGLRCFVALQVEDTARQALEPWLTEARERFRDLSVTPPENLHLTLAFLGELDESGVEAARGNHRLGGGSAGSGAGAGLRSSPLPEQAGETVRGSHAADDGGLRLDGVVLVRLHKSPEFAVRTFVPIQLCSEAVPQVRRG